MISETVVELSRGQFAFTAVLQFLVMPLTLGLSLLLVIMESWFVIGGQSLYQQMAQFWGRLFAVSFGLSMVASLAMAIQFGVNWSYFAHYAGDAFGLALLIGLAGLFLAANGAGWFLFGGQRLGKVAHLVSIWLICIGCHVNLFGFVMASGWMQNPLGAELNPQSLRLEVTDLHLLFCNPVGLAKFVHSLLAAYVTAAGFVLAISAYYLLKQRETLLAQASFRVAAVLGLLMVIATMAIGDRSIYASASIQRSKFAAINGLSNDDLLAQNRQRIGNGLQAYALLQEIRDEKNQPQLLSDFAAKKPDLGYALLLKRWKENVTDANPAQIEQAALASLPAPQALFWGYKAMILVGCLMLALFALASFASIAAWRRDWLLKLCFYGLPLPWLASGSGWFISEFGRQPWMVADILPSWQGVSTLTTTDLILSFAGYGLAYVGLLALAGFLILKLVRQGSALALPIAQESEHVA